METVSWGPALAALAAGLAAGAVLVWRLRGARPAPPTPAEEAEARRRDLEAHRDTLLDQLRELDDVGGRDPEILARERERLELLAARVLAELDRQAPAAARRPAAEARPAAASAAVPADPRRAARRGFAWGIGSAAAAAALVIWVWGAARPRGQGGQLTGDLPQRSQAAQPPGAAQADPELEQLQQAVAASPDDVEARLELTRAYLSRSDMMQVWEQTQEILARSPGNPRALSYQALVRLAMGQTDAAEEQLQKVVAAAPELLEPRLSLGLVYMRTGRTEKADAVLDEAVRRFPTQKAALERLRAEMKATQQPQAETFDHPEVAANAMPAPGGGPAAAPAAGGAHVAGEIELDPARGAVPAGAIVFVTARAVGQEGGPPLAVKRLPAAFPLRFTLGAEDSMMGQELPAQLRLEARLDADGDPLTRAAADPSARLDAVRLGQGDVRLRLR